MNRQQISLILLGGVAVLAAIVVPGYMQWREDNTLHVCVSPPHPVGNCATIVAVPGDRLFLNDIAKVPATGPVVQNYWVEINGRRVPVETLEDGRNGVNLYATVPQPDTFAYGPSALSRAQQLFQNCINIEGRLHALDVDADGFLPELRDMYGDTVAYPCVVGSYLLPPYVMPATADMIGTDRDDNNPNVH